METAQIAAFNISCPQRETGREDNGAAAEVAAYATCCLGVENVAK